MSRYHRRANDLSLGAGELDHLRKLHNKALDDLLDRKDLRFPDPVSAPEASRAAEFTVDAVQRSGADDKQLIAAMGQLHNDPHAQEQILQTLDWMDRRDRVEQDRAAREERRDAEASWHDDRHDADYDGGLDEEVCDSRSLFAEQIAVAPGRRLSKKAQAREDYERYLFNQYLDAEADCRGHMLTREGEAKGIDPASLFLANRAVMNRYASDELKSWWQRNGHMSLAEYRYKVLGWESDREAARRRRAEFDAA